MGIKITPCKDVYLEEAARLFDLYRQFYEQKPDYKKAYNFISQRISQKDSTIFLALDDKNSGAGFLQLYPLFSSVQATKIWLLNDLYVHKDYRQQGVGRMLMDQGKKFAKETSATTIMLETHKDNTIAQKLYENLGYVREEGSYFYALSL